jgi:hypothetical protein
VVRLLVCCVESGKIRTTWIDGCRMLMCRMLCRIREGRQKDPDPARPTEILLFISIARNKIISLGK